MKFVLSLVSVALSLPLLAVASASVDWAEVLCGETTGAQPIDVEVDGWGMSAQAALQDAETRAETHILDAFRCDAWDCEEPYSVGVGVIMIPRGCPQNFRWEATTWEPTVVQTPFGWQATIHITGEYTYECSDCDN